MRGRSADAGGRPPARVPRRARCRVVGEWANVESLPFSLVGSRCPQGVSGVVRDAKTASPGFSLDGAGEIHSTFRWNDSRIFTRSTTTH
jgi:hypothetical protein